MMTCSIMEKGSNYCERLLQPNRYLYVLPSIENNSTITKHNANPKQHPSVSNVCTMLLFMRKLHPAI